MSEDDEKEMCVDRGNCEKRIMREEQETEAFARLTLAKNARAIACEPQAKRFSAFSAVFQQKMPAEYRGSKGSCA